MKRVANHKSVLPMLIAFSLGIGAIAWTNLGRAVTLESPGPRQGYTLAISPQAIFQLGHDADLDWLDPTVGGGGDLRLGQSVTHWLDLGVGTGFFSAANPDYSAIWGHLSIEARALPAERLFLHLGVGFGFSDVSRRRAELDKVSGAVGAAYTVGVGFDFYPLYTSGSGGLTISPIVQMRIMPSSPLAVYAATVGIEIGFWTGLAKNQLKVAD